MIDLTASNKHLFLNSLKVHDPRLLFLSALMHVLACVRYCHDGATPRLLPRPPPRQVVPSLIGDAALSNAMELDDALGAPPTILRVGQQYDRT